MEENPPLPPPGGELKIYIIRVLFLSAKLAEICCFSPLPDEHLSTQFYDVKLTYPFSRFFDFNLALSIERLFE